MLRFIRLPLLVSIAALTSASARSAEPIDPVRNSTPAEGWIVTLGGTLQLGPKYDGANKAGLSGMPSISWRRANEPASFSAPDDSVDFALYSTKIFSIGPAASFRAGRYSGSDVRLNGLRDVRWSIEPGAFVEFWPIEGRLRTRAEVRHGVHGHNGFVADISADWVEKIGRMTLSAGPRLALGDTAFMRRNFGITPAESVANGRVAAFSPNGGVKSLGAAAAMSYAWSPQWTSLAYARYDRLMGDAGKSPLARTIGQRDQLTIGLGATYSFNVSGW